MLVCSAHFTPYVVQCVLPKQLNLSFISPQNLGPVAFWSVEVLFDKFQVFSDVFSGEQQLHQRWPAMDTIPAHVRDS